jgi:hypothetical protein
MCTAAVPRAGGPAAVLSMYGLLSQCLSCSIWNLLGGCEVLMHVELRIVVCSSLSCVRVTGKGLLGRESDRQR